MYNITAIELSITDAQHVYFNTTFPYYSDRNEPQREKTYLLTCVCSSKDAVQPANPHSLIRVFVVCMKKLCILITKTRLFKYTENFTTKKNFR